MGGIVGVDEMVDRITGRKRYTKNPIKFIKNFIYYLPATWYMLRAFVYYRILHRNRYHSV